MNKIEKIKKRLFINKGNKNSKDTENLKKNLLENLILEKSPQNHLQQECLSLEKKNPKRLILLQCSKEVINRTKKTRRIRDLKICKHLSENSQTLLEF